MHRQIQTMRQQQHGILLIYPLTSQTTRILTCERKSTGKAQRLLELFYFVVGKHVPWRNEGIQQEGHRPTTEHEEWQQSIGRT